MLSVKTCAVDPLAAALSSLGVSIPDTPFVAYEDVLLSGMERGYAIVTTGRAGSTWLSSALGEIPGAGYPSEFFAEDGVQYFGDFSAPQSFITHFRWLLSHYQDEGTFGFKIDPRRLFFLEKIIDIHKTFSRIPFCWVDLRRLNIVRQAFSYALARKTGVWHDFASAPQSRKENLPVLRDQEIWDDIKRILTAEQSIDRYYSLRSIRPLRLFYEEIYDSKADLLDRVLWGVDNKKAWSVGMEPADKTRKIAPIGDFDDMLSFSRRYQPQLNALYMARDRIDPAVLP